MSLVRSLERPGPPVRVVELLAAATGVELSPRAAREALALDAVAGEDWSETITRVGLRAGLQSASFEVEGASELERLRELELPALTRVDERWLLVRGSRGPLLELTIFDELGEQARAMLPSALLDWLVAHTPAALPMRWLVFEPRQGLAPLVGIESPMRRLIAYSGLERRDLGIVAVQALAIGAASLAVPIAAQALVNTVATSAMVQPLVVLGLLLAIGLGFYAALRVAQAVVVERIQQRIFARVAIDLARRIPRFASGKGSRGSAELVNRFFDVITLQKSAAALLIDGTTLVLQIGIGLLLLGFYHPWLLAFDIVLVLGIFGVLAIGRGAMQTSLAESASKYAMAAWLEDIASARLRFADPHARRFAEARAELLLREWLLARRRHFARLLRHLVGGIGLQVLASVGLLTVGGLLVIQRQLTLGQLVSAELVVALIAAGLGKLGKHLESLYDAATAVTKIAKLVDLPLEAEGREALPARAGALAVELRDTSEQAPLTALAPGMRLGLVGCTRTHARLLDVLYGFAESERLAVRLDGIELERLDPGRLREHVVLVRGAELVIGSVLDNLDGRASMSEGDGEELVTLLELVDMRERLFALPQQLATRVLGEGAPFDRNEARRLALVRALLRRPRLLLIDRGLDGLGLSPERRRLLLDWLFARERPWTLIVASEDSALLDRCDVRIELDHA